MKRMFDVVCFSHLRWNFVFQRPQHLLSRCARDHRVFFIEEPLFEGTEKTLRVVTTKEGVMTVVPVFPEGTPQDEIVSVRHSQLEKFFAEQKIQKYVAWYYTPMALDWVREDKAMVTVYDCMDELSAFKGASPLLKEREKRLFEKADLVFTGGVSLYERKRQMHPNVYAFPSSVDVAHFAKARTGVNDPADQANIPHPRLGFFGVVDERMDIQLLGEVAQLKPDFQFVIVGPVVKIDPATLPKRDNIHYLGGKSYDELPAYLSGWDVALMPFALNESTEFISPTKTPEYLAAGRPVVSTPIRDVVKPYGVENLVHIADEAQQFADACEAALKEDSEERQKRVEPFLSKMSWDSTWRSMAELIDGVLETKSTSITEASHV